MYIPYQLYSMFATPLFSKIKKFALEHPLLVVLFFSTLLLEAILLKCEGFGLFDRAV
jgi:hypothetical protein